MSPTPPAGAPAEGPTDPAPGQRLAEAARRYWFVAVVAVAAVELLAHLRQVSAVVPREDFDAARALVAPEIRAEDLVLFAPAWVEPVGRQAFGDALAGIERSGRADETRFARVFEVSIRGAHRPEVAGFPVVSTRAVGGVTVTLFDNPSYKPVIDDLVAHVHASGASVYQATGGEETACAWFQGSTQGGSTVVPQGALVPAARFQCNATYVAVGVLHALDHSGRRCIWAPPFGGESALRIKIAAVRFGASLHGHHGMQWVDERAGRGAPVTAVYRSGDTLLGQVVHSDGQGWKGFELPTPELAGKTAPLTIDVTATSGDKRHYCFEATTR